MRLADVLTRKRWYWLALPDDANQCLALARLMHRTEHRQAVALDYLLRTLRHEVWDRQPTRRPRKPAQLRPSRDNRATGYRRDSDRHAQAYLRRGVPVKDGNL